MTEIEQLLFAMGLDVSPSPDTLYHYTSAEAFLSIVRFGRIWATHIHFLNDTSEAEWMLEAALERLTVRAASASSDEEKTSLIRVIDLVTDRNPCTDFVASFSENGDDLSQWRAYCHNGPGFSIGFSTDALRSQWIWNPSGPDSFFVGAGLGRVVYLDQNNLADLDKSLELVFKWLSPQVEGLEWRGQVLSREQHSAGWLLTRASMYKHYSFRDEHEWRLVLSKPHKPMPGQQFRPGRSSLVPYVEVELNRDYKSERPAKRIINKVIIGPSPDPELSVQSTKALFVSLGQLDVDVVASTIPYKNW